MTPPDNHEVDGNQHVDGSQHLDDSTTGSVSIEDAATDLAALPVVRIKPRRALPFFARHPWVFAGAIESIEGQPDVGDEVLLTTDDGEPIARGLFNPHSNIRVRLYEWDADVALDADFFTRQIRSAISLRRRLFPEFHDRLACRLINSEGDGLSGLTVDRYGPWLLLQITSLAMAHRRDDIVRILQQEPEAQGVWRRTEKGAGDDEGVDQQDGLIAGAEPTRPYFIEENGLQFGIDLLQGQKTGYYLDQRDNRLAVSRYLDGLRVLDAFCYSGGFGLTALRRGNAANVLAIDSSEPALDLARNNAELNGLGSRIEFQRENVYQALERLQSEGRQFEAVILDPPKLARHRSGVAQAIKGYHSLNRLAVELIPPGGLLISCSCSGHVSRDQFAEMLGSVGMRTRRSIQILEQRGHAADHPISAHCPESNYLKCFICRVL